MGAGSDIHQDQTLVAMQAVVERLDEMCGDAESSIRRPDTSIAIMYWQEVQSRVEAGRGFGE